MEVSLEDFDSTLTELLPIYRQHYEEMRTRLANLGTNLSPFNPRLDEYSKASRGGWLLTFVLRLEKKAIGYCNVYVTHDMHNRDLIAQEDTIYVLPKYRNGNGRLLSRFVHDELKRRGVVRMNVTTSTDLKVSKWLARQGYKHTAHCMSLTL